MKKEQTNFFAGHVVDVVKRRIFKGIIEVKGGYISAINEADVKEGVFLLPGFIDSHVHIESSMLIPSAFAGLAVSHGTTACVSDPHELANVLGVDGVKFMINNGKRVPFKFYFGAPSCVPATPFETSGAVIDSQSLEHLLKLPEIKYLAEMMNFPGVIHQDPEVMKKIALAHKYHKKIDGHAPGLTGDSIQKYVEAGISTDHECTTIEEAVEKISYGMKILIREGSAAKNFNELIPLIERNPDAVMLCTDDMHPDDLIKGHINALVRRAVEKGYDIINVLRSVTYNPVKHYRLDAGLLQVGDKADFIVVDNLSDFNIIETYIDGEVVYKNGTSLIGRFEEKPVNTFNCHAVKASDLPLKATSGKIRVIGALEGQLLTKELIEDTRIENGQAIADTERDILKMVVLQRYKDSKPAVAFVKGFGLKYGAMASTIAHDSHNIIAVGVHDEDIAAAINILIEAKGGVAAVDGHQKTVLPLPFGGLMTDLEGEMVAEKYATIEKMVKQFGSPLKSPFMTLSFMALLVIPDIKLSDKGLFDGRKFQFTKVFV